MSVQQTFYRLDADIRTKYQLGHTELNLDSLNARVHQISAQRRRFRLQSMAGIKDWFLYFRLFVANLEFEPAFASVLIGFLAAAMFGGVATLLVDLNHVLAFCFVLAIVLLLWSAGSWTVWQLLRYPRGMEISPKQYLVDQIAERSKRRQEARASYDASKRLLSELESAIRRLKSAIEEQQTRDMRLDERRRLMKLNWESLGGVEFELRLRELYELNGYKVEMTPDSGDHGGDLIVEKNGHRTCIQAKRWEGSVGNKAVQQAYAGMGFYDCHDCAVVTTSQFTRKAVELAQKLGCTLIDSDGLRQMIKGENLQPVQYVTIAQPFREVTPQKTSSQDDFVEALEDERVERPGGENEDRLMPITHVNRSEEGPSVDFEEDSEAIAKAKIRRHAEKEWPDDFDMQLHVVEEEFRDYQKLSSFKRNEQIPDKVYCGIRRRAAKEWPNQYSMQLHTVRSEMLAFLKIIRLSPSGVPSGTFLAIKAKAQREWSDKYDMQLHTIEEQLRAYKRLHQLG